MRKRYSRWVPRLLTIGLKRIRVTTSEQMFVYFNSKLKKFLRRFVTMDETWINRYTPRSCEGSKQWAPKHPKTQQSAGKVMTSVFWDAHGVILINYLKEGRLLKHIMLNH